jgi:signal transduction histidine kinase
MSFRTHRSQRRWRRSLRVRLVMWFLVLALVMTGVFVGGMQKSFGSGWAEAARPMLTDYADRLVAEIGSPPDVARAKALTQRLPITIRIVGPSVNWASHPDPQGRPWRGERELSESHWFVRATADGHRIVFGWAPSIWQFAPRAAGWATLVALLALVLLMYAAVSRLLRPLIDIREGAERFGRGDFAEPIPIRRRDDLGDLAQRINTMAHDLQGMLDAKRALLLALSHELRSPLTRARLNAELLPDTPDGATERAALLRDLNEMRDLITDLLESERLASPHAALQREPIDLAALIREVAAELPSGASIALELAELPPRPLDRARVRLLVRNLLDNALRHGAGAPQAPCVSLKAVGQSVRLEVRDFGPGVDDAQLEHLTEPFYRTDSARQRATGGVGLGMYLCRLVVEAHGGTLALRNAHPGLAIAVLFV